MLQSRILNKIVVADGHSIRIGVHQSLGGGYGTIFSRKIALPLYGHAGTGSSYRNLFLVNQVIDSGFHRCIPPVADIIPLVTSGNPKRLCLFNAGYYIGIGSRSSCIKNNGFHRIHCNSQVAVQVVIVAIAATCAQHNYIATT